MLSLDSPHDKQLQIAQRLKNLRLLQKLKQQSVAERSGMSVSALKRFESTGEISFGNLTRIALVLGALDDFDLLFKNENLGSIKDWNQPLPQRGRS